MAQDYKLLFDVHLINYQWSVGHFVIL